LPRYRADTRALRSSVAVIAQQYESIEQRLLLLQQLGEVLFRLKAICFVFRYLLCSLINTNLLTNIDIYDDCPFKQNESLLEDYTAFVKYLLANVVAFDMTWVDLEFRVDDDDQWKELYHTDRSSFFQELVNVVVRETCLHVVVHQYTLFKPNFTQHFVKELHPCK
jgi:hypothetical protein